MFWNWLTRFGDSTWLLPLATLGAFGMADASRRWAASVAWLLPLGIATLLVLASKVAFLGFGLGIAALDFTGASGHAMAAFAIYPVLGYVLTRAPARRARVVLSIGVAIVLASAIAISRLAIGVHSPSECVVGALCGALASGVSIAWLRSLPQAMLAPRWWWLVIGVAALATSTGGVARGGPPSPTHTIVSRLALRLSGRAVVFERADLVSRETGSRSR